MVAEDLENNRGRCCCRKTFRGRSRTESKCETQSAMHQEAWTLLVCMQGKVFAVALVHWQAKAQLNGVTTLRAVARDIPDFAVIRWFREGASGTNDVRYPGRPRYGRVAEELLAKPDVSQGTNARYHHNVIASPSPSSWIGNWMWKR